MEYKTVREITDWGTTRNKVVIDDEEFDAVLDAKDLLIIDSRKKKEAYEVEHTKLQKELDTWKSKKKEEDWNDEDYDTYYEYYDKINALEDNIEVLDDIINKLESNY